MPSPLANTAGTDGWISIILGWVIIILTLEKNPEKTFKQILITYFGKWLGTIFILLYALYLFFAGFNTLLKAKNIVKVWIFPSTPAYQIAILFTITFYYFITEWD